MNFLNETENKFLQSGDYKEVFPRLEETMNTPRFSIKDLGVSPRDATYWSNKEILPYQIDQKSTRRSYNLKQAIWIKLIQQLRALEVSLSLIKKIKESLLDSAINIADLLKDERFREIVSFMLEESGGKKLKESFLEDKDLVKKLKDQKVDVFEMLILNMIVFRTPSSIIAFTDGQCLPYVYNKHDYLRKHVEGFDELFNKPHLLLSLSEAYKELINDWSNKKWFDEITIVTENERKILNILNDDKTDELTIYKKDGEVDRLEQVSKNKLEAISRLSDCIVKNGYQKIEVKTRNGKPVYIENTLSLKLDSLPE